MNAKIKVALNGVISTICFKLKKLAKTDQLKILNLKN